MKNKTNPTYFQWFFGEHCKDWRGKLKVVATLYGIFQIIYLTPIINEEYLTAGDFPLITFILTHLAMWGFLIGIIYQPYNIYRKLIKLDWFNRKKDNFIK